MKKQLAAAILASVTLAVAAPAMAAANPFVDVPARHWAYDAVTKLAASGVVDGYGDGTFRGDKTITRYEMAQIVAKAMAKSSSLSDADKATVDELAQEFSDELQSLGVRVAALEAAAKPAVTWSGSVRFQTTSDEDDDTTDALTNKLRLRLSAKAQVNDNTTVGFRLAAENTMSTVGTSGTGLYDADGDEYQKDEWNAKLDHLYVATELGDFNVTAGRYDYWLGQGGLNGDNIITGLQVAKGKFNAVAGREWDADEDMVGVAYSGVPIGATTWGVNFVDYSDLDNATYVGGDVKLDLGGIGLLAQYSTNTELDSDPEGYRVDATLAKYWTVGYQNIEANAINDDGTTLDVGSNYKGWDIEYAKGIAKNTEFEIKYWDMEKKSNAVVDGDKDDEAVRARLIYKF